MRLLLDLLKIAVNKRNFDSVPKTGGQDERQHASLVVLLCFLFEHHDDEPGNMKILQCRFPVRIASTITPLPISWFRCHKFDLPSRMSPRARHFSSEPEKNWNEDESFFTFTRARYVRDEEAEMARHYVKFDMNELARIAARTAGSNRCVDVKKYPDGMYSKAFLMTTDHGKEVVAKVPNPNAGLAHYTTASEVATMEFVSA